MRYWVQYHYGSQYEGKGYTVFAKLERALSFIEDYVKSSDVFYNPDKPEQTATGVTIEDRSTNETYYIPLLIHERFKERYDEKG